MEFWINFSNQGVCEPRSQGRLWHWIYFCRFCIIFLHEIFHPEYQMFAIPLHVRSSLPFRLMKAWRPSKSPEMEAAQSSPWNVDERPIEARRSEGRFLDERKKFRRRSWSVFWTWNERNSSKSSVHGCKHVDLHWLGETWTNRHGEVWWEAFFIGSSPPGSLTWNNNHPRDKWCVLCGSIRTFPYQALESGFISSPRTRNLDLWWLDWRLLSKLKANERKWCPTTTSRSTSSSSCGELLG